MFVLPGTFMFRVPRRMPDRIAVLTEQMAVAYGAFGRAFQNPNSKEGYAPPTSWSSRVSARSGCATR